MSKLDEKVLAAKCKNLVAEYQDTITQIIDEELLAMSGSIDITGSIESIGKDSVYKAGIKEGMRRILAKIIKKSNGIN